MLHRLVITFIAAAGFLTAFTVKLAHAEQVLFLHVGCLTLEATTAAAMAPKALHTEMLRGQIEQGACFSLNEPIQVECDAQPIEFDLPGVLVVRFRARGHLVWSWSWMVTVEQHLAACAGTRA
jgi:hypothetical protein